MFFIFFRKRSTIQDLVLRFPHLLEQIFQKLDNKSLFKCREVARSWQNIIDGRNYPWLRIVNIPRILKRRNTYLHLAARTGQIEPFKTALYEEEDKNIKNQRGETFFHLACKNGRLKIVHLLLTNLEFDISGINNHDIDLGAKTKYGNTAFYYACFKGHVDVVKILMENADVFSFYVRAKNSAGNTAFHMACKEGHANVIKILMENAAAFRLDLNMKNNDGMTAVHLAGISGNGDVFKELMTSLTTSVVVKNSDVIKLFMENVGWCQLTPHYQITNEWIYFEES